MSKESLRSSEGKEFFGRFHLVTLLAHMGSACAGAVLRGCDFHLEHARIGFLSAPINEDKVILPGLFQQCQGLLQSSFLFSLIVLSAALLQEKPTLEKQLER